MRLAILYAPFEASRRDQLLEQGYGGGSNIDEIRTYECDITSPDSVRSAFDSLEKDMVVPDSSFVNERAFPSILINTAGYVSLSDMEITPPEETMKHLTTNVFGPMLCSQAFARLYFAASKDAESSTSAPAPPPRSDCQHLFASGPCSPAPTWCLLCLEGCTVRPDTQHGVGVGRTWHHF